ncbi:hypothetical protein IGI04_009851 [Brassica rapa subsp. trilocularis]|uniref:Peptidase C1A papain C-terminal domain-containing protein n=1 Tax=Brassica rapa subsp. trilocularis TaxID=1813537 RepID=A0ABQ7MYM1_BRACM|nr:hypothetical protein IGI04_009851 [Brassica rapa subsp. trilocularis]
MQQRLELFIHHIVNHVKIDANECIINLKSALSFMKSSSVCVEIESNDMSILQRIHQHDLTTYPCNPKVHNVLIVGFGDFEGRHYWIVQNLWREG